MSSQKGGDTGMSMQDTGMSCESMLHVSSKAVQTKFGIHYSTHISISKKFLGLILQKRNKGEQSGMVCRMQQIKYTSPWRWIGKWRIQSTGVRWDGRERYTSYIQYFSQLPEFFRSLWSLMSQYLFGEFVTQDQSANLPFHTALKFNPKKARWKHEDK